MIEVREKRAKIILADANESTVDRTIPNGVTHIAERCFEGCVDLESIDIPPSVVSIGRGAFQHTRLREVFIPKTVKFLDVEAFRYCDYLTSVVFEEGGICAIRNSTFLGCPQLRSVTIPAKVAAIGNDVFTYIPRSQLTIYTPELSYAEGWAKKEKMNVETI